MSSRGGRRSCRGAWLTGPLVGRDEPPARPCARIRCVRYSPSPRPLQTTLTSAPRRGGNNSEGMASRRAGLQIRDGVVGSPAHATVRFPSLGVPACRQDTETSDCACDNTWSHGRKVSVLHAPAPEPVSTVHLSCHVRHYVPNEHIPQIVAVLSGSTQGS
jgi:hypothetical protein